MSSDVLQMPLNVPLNGAQTAAVRLDFGAGDLNIGALQPGSKALASGTLEYFENQPEPWVTFTPGLSATLQIEAQMAMDLVLPFGATRTIHWNIGLDPQVVIDFTVKTGASKLTLDLEHLRANRVDVNLGASTATLVLPAAAGNTQAVVQGGAMTMQIYVPASIEALITIDSGVSSVRVDSRFRRQGGYYASGGYGRGQNNLDLAIEVGAASVSVISR